MKFKNVKLEDPITKAPTMIGSEELTLATALAHALTLNAADDKKPFTPSEKMERYTEIVRLQKVMIEQEFELTPEMFVALKEDVNRLFNVPIGGQILWYLNSQERH